MEKNIEIEVRGPLSIDDYTRLVNYLEKNATKKNSKERVLIDYSTFLDTKIENRKVDIRLRVTNGIPEIIVKKGSWGGSEQRKELSVLASKGEFDKLVEIFDALGLNKGVLCVRNSKVYDYKGVEFAVVEVPGHSYYFEAEMMAAADESGDAILANVTKVCDDLALKLFSKEEFFAYIETLNKEANEVFEFKNWKENYFNDRFNLKK